MKALLNFTIADGCCTSQARHQIWLNYSNLLEDWKLDEYLLDLLKEDYGDKINNNKEEILEWLHSNSGFSVGGCENCGEIYIYGDSGKIGGFEINKGEFENVDDFLKYLGEDEEEEERDTDMLSN